MLARHRTGSTNRKQSLPQSDRPPAGRDLVPTGVGTGLAPNHQVAKQHMKHTIILTVLLLGGQVRQGHLAAIAIGPCVTPGPFGLGALTIDGLQRRHILVTPGPGDLIEGQTLRLDPTGVEDKQFRVEIRYQTSLTVMNEERHFELADWKHYTSPWRSLKEESLLTYTIPKFTEAESKRFPEVSQADIDNAVLKRSGRRFANDLRDRQRRAGLSYGVSISKYFIRISVLEKTRWEVLNMIELTNPERGC